MASMECFYSRLLWAALWTLCVSGCLGLSEGDEPQGGHLKWSNHPFTSDIQELFQGRTHAGTIMFRNLQTLLQGEIKKQHHSVMDQIPQRNGRKNLWMNKISGIPGIPIDVNDVSDNHYSNRNNSNIVDYFSIKRTKSKEGGKGASSKVQIIDNSPGIKTPVRSTEGSIGSVDEDPNHGHNNKNNVNQATRTVKTLGNRKMPKAIAWLQQLITSSSVIETKGKEKSSNSRVAIDLKDSFTSDKIRNVLLLEMVKRFSGIQKQLVGLIPTGGSRKRRSIGNGTLPATSNDTNSTDPDSVDVNGLIPYDKFGNQTLDSGVLPEQEVVNGTVRSNDNGSSVSPLGTSTQPNQGVSVSENDNKENEISRNSSLATFNGDVDNNGTVLGVMESTGNKSIPEGMDDTMKVGPDNSTTFDTAGIDHVTTASNGKNSGTGNSDKSNMSPSGTSQIPEGVTTPISKAGDKMVTSDTEVQVTSSSINATPLSAAQEGTKKSPETDTGGKEIKTAKSLSAPDETSSVKTASSKTDLWAIKSDFITKSGPDDLDLNMMTTAISPSYQGSNGNDPKSSSTNDDNSKSQDTSSTSNTGDVNDNDNPSVSSQKSKQEGSIPEPTTEFQPQPTSTAASEPISHPEPEPEPEPEGRLEPEAETESGSSFPSAEPGPEWELAKDTWSYAWEIHIYTFGSLFGVLGLYSLLCLLRLWRIQRLLSKPYFISLNCLMLLMCSTRSIYMLYDGYNSNGTFHLCLDYFLYSISFPCLTSAFSILLYALLKATNMQLVSPAVQRMPVLVFIIIVHFVISIATDVLIAFYAGMQVMLFVCQMYFVMWGLFLFFGYAYIFRKLYSHAVKRQKNVLYSSPSNASSTSAALKSKFTLSTAVKITFFTAICGLITVGLEIYAVVGVYKTFTRERPKPWPWWLYHTVLRLIEFLMCLTMSYVASQPFRYRRSESKCSCGILCAPCSEILCCGQTINRSNSIAGWSDLDIANTGSRFNSMNNETVASDTKKFSNNHSLDAVPIIDLQPMSESRPNSLLIIEDGYVRFQTDNDINRIVDSYNDLSDRPDNIHNMNTFPLRDGFVNTGYSYNTEDRKAKEENDLKDKSRKSSLTSSEFFRVPSSVSLADSMETELEKAFESFKLDTSAEDDQDTRSFDLILVSDLSHLKETDLISVDSDTVIKDDKAARRENPDFQNGEAVHAYQTRENNHEDKKKSNNSQLQVSETSRPLQSLRRAKSSEIDDTPLDSYTQQKLYRSHSDHASNSDVRDSSGVKYSYLHDLDSTENQGIISEERNATDNDPEVLHSNRRPSEGQGQQAAILTSLLKSKHSGSNDNIDV